ncbi:putative phosphoglucomutase [Diplonema papillatum]|nr:putative phosphoglucomutase [Diplonema papillatum]|eukprot:gene22440-34372_t
MVKEFATKPIAGQKPGTSGLRQKTRTFMQPGYLENFTQAVYNAVADTYGGVAAGGTVVLGGDGRFYNKQAIQTLIKMSVANGVDTVWIGRDGLLSTPAVSAIIRGRQPEKGRPAPFGGFILSASHNPGGIDEDFGIKYNCENGGPAPEKVTNCIFEHTKRIASYKSYEDFPVIDVATVGRTELDVDGRKIVVDVFDSAEDHVAVLKRCFDFPAIREFVAREDFSMVYDCMNGVQGPYAHRVFVEEFGLPAAAILNGEPREDFGGPGSAHHGHADPNLTHARLLVATMGLTKEGRALQRGGGAEIPAFGAAADGDADRNMILGRQFFVSPSDSLAVIAANAKAIPCFSAGLRGCARSMPTSMALDRVAEAQGLPCFETPTGWKYFGNLMDAGNPKYFPEAKSLTPFLCGEESFGTGSDHIREKDGMWAALAWLQILAVRNKDAKKVIGVEDIVTQHWQTYGRNYYARYDYEAVSKAVADEMMAGMEKKVNQDLAQLGAPGFELRAADSFSYTDPVDLSAPQATKQGIRWIFRDGSRIVFRLSGTGVSGATIRMYLECYVGPEGELGAHPFDKVLPLAKHAMTLSGLPSHFPAAKAAEKDETGARLGLAFSDGVCTPDIIT